MEERVWKVMGFLRGSGGGTRVVGLHGEGGIGKTTLMRVTEANLRRDSEHDDAGNQSMYKIAWVEVGMRPPALMELQKSLYIQLSDGSKEIFSSEAQGRAALKELMERLKGQGKKICVFLDNVWELRNLVELLPQRDLADVLSHGSYLVISSRSADVVAGLAGMCFKTEQEQTEGYLDYQLHTLLKQDAEDLFLRKAYRDGEEKPLQRDDPLVQAIVPRCSGLPLALTVYGSYFKDGKRRKLDVWKRVLEQMERAEDLPCGDDWVFQKIKDSVCFQSERLQDVFIDVALLCRSDYFDDVKLVMEEEDDLNSLVDQSLVTRRGEGVEIHDLLLAVAKQMAKERSILFITNDTSQDEIAEMLLPHPQLPQVPSIRAFDETAWYRYAENCYPSSAQIQDVRYLKLNSPHYQSLVNQRREFGLMITKHCHKLWMLELQFENILQEQLSWIANLKQLRVLSVEGDSFAGISKMSSQLRVFKVCLRNSCCMHHDFSSSLLEASFTTLRWLHIIGIEDEVLPQWVGQLGFLAGLNLSGCMSLFQVPKELGQLGSLMSLNLSGCSSLVELPKELGQLGSLMRLDLSGCTSLAQLPKELGQLGSLTWLDLSKCISLLELPKELGQLSSLTGLHLSGCTSLVELPKELGQLGSLMELDLYGCTSLVQLPKELGQLSSLVGLNLSGCSSLVELPKELGQLASLTGLHLSGCISLVELPEELGELGSLTGLDLSGCTSLVRLPKELGQLGPLMWLNLAGCTSLVELPKELGHLGFLMGLHLSKSTSWVERSEELGQSGSLRGLNLSGCPSLAQLPKELGQLGSLAWLNLSKCTRLVELPEELGQLGSLTWLDLSRCTSLVKLPQELGQLGSLTGLDLSGCRSLVQLPTELGQLGSLMWLNISGCTSLVELPKELGQLGSLTELYLSGCTSLVKLPKELGQLGFLTGLQLSGCTSLVELPKELGQLGSLTWLDLSGCMSLVQLPEELAENSHRANLTGQGVCQIFFEEASRLDLEGG